MANSEFATRREVIKNRSAFYASKPSSPRYAIFLRNAFAQHTMTVKLVSLTFEPSFCSGIEKSSPFLQQVYAFSNLLKTRDIVHTAYAVSCQLGDVRLNLVKPVNEKKEITQVANSESVA